MVSAGLSAPTASGAGIAASTLSPAASYEIGQYFKGKDAEGSAAHILAHTILGAAVAATGGNNALSAGIAAGGAEAAAPLLAEYLYGKKAKDLTASEKSTISSIVGLAGSAVGTTTGDVSSTVQGGQSAQNAVENNSLLGRDTRKKVNEFFNGLSSKVKHPIDQGAIKGVGTVADGLLMIADAFGDTAVSAIHCPLGTSACADAMENNRQKGQAVIDFLTNLDLKEQANKIKQSYQDLSSGDPEKVANAQRTQAEVFTSLGLSATSIKKLGANNVSELKTLEKTSEVVKQKETIKENIAKSQKAREVSNFDTHVLNEKVSATIPPNMQQILLEHNTQIGTRNSAGSISGSHNIKSFNQALDKSGSALIGEPIIDPKYPGLKTYNYQAPGVDRAGKPDGSYKNVQQKTVYDPKIISDQKMVDMQMQAVKKGAELLLPMPIRNRTVDVNIEGYVFTVTRDKNTGKILNAFPVIPNAPKPLVPPKYQPKKLK